MTLEERVAKLEKQIKRLNGSVLQMQKNQTPQTATLDNTVSGLDAITPYTETKQGYIGDTEITFNNVPSGNVSVFGLNSYSIAWELGDLKIAFPALEEVTDITISIV